MNTKTLDHLLTNDERQTFERDGYIIVPSALSSDQVDHFTAIVDNINTHERDNIDRGARNRLNIHDTIGADNCLLELIDWPTTFAKVWALMGWNIQLYHTQLIVSPPPAPDEEMPQKRLGWHQDNNRMNKDLDLRLEPQPMVSLKVAFFLTDTTRVGNGNFYVVPGSHLHNSLDWRKNGVEEPVGAAPTQPRAGDAVIFDRRLWHAASPNFLDTPRKVLFYGYSYRWLRPKCDMNVAHLLDEVDPIRRQLLGWATSANGRYDPQPEDVPLRAWIEEHVGKEAVARWEMSAEQRKSEQTGP